MRDRQFARRPREQVEGSVSSMVQLEHGRFDRDDCIELRASARVEPLQSIGELEVQLVAWIRLEGSLRYSAV